MATVTLNDLTSMSQADLDDLFRRAPLGELPDGDALGTAIVAPGTEIEGPVLWLARWLAWQGKFFYRAQGYLLNKVGPFGMHLIKAKVYVAPSWFDGQPAIILDYSKTSLVAHKVRDEIREVSPGTYLGIVFYGTQKTINFVLQFSTSPANWA
ncbi:MAG TPA: hypothetical protein VF937_15825 [Chloroflexota bacterium]